VINKLDRQTDAYDSTDTHFKVSPDIWRL